MTNKIFYILLFLAFCLPFSAQEQLTPLKVNPALFKAEKNEGFNLRSVTKDSFIYELDTISIPFFDDFSTNKFMGFNASISDPDVVDTTLFKIYIGNSPDLSENFYALDSTFNFTYDSVAGEEVVIKTPLTSINIKIYDISRYPANFLTKEVWPPYNAYDTTWIQNHTTFNDTITNIEDLLFQASKNYYVVAASSDGSIWADNFVYRNTQLPINPPSIYVASFDGLDENGMPYDNSGSGLAYGEADFLTSKPIDLEFTNANDIYLSFFWQTQGMSGDKTVQEQDSLILEFYNPTSKTWTLMWSQKYVELGNFKHEIIQVPHAFQQKGFQFRFMNNATLSGALDYWHIDYVYLNNNRSQNDTIYDDLSTQYQAPSLIEPYTAMLWSHYKISPEIYMKNTAKVHYRNNDEAGKILTNLAYTISNPDAAATHYQNIGGGTKGNIGAETSDSTDYDIYTNYNYIFDQSIADNEQTIFNVAFSVSTSTPNDTLQSNDTCYFEQKFTNYYAYDDGSAEAGYVVFSDFGYPEMALEYQTPITDSLRAIDIYFIPALIDAEGEGFVLAIWDDLTADPIFENENYSYPVYGVGVDGFTRYQLESPVEVSGTYYIGIRQKISGNKINLGYDLNLDNSSRFYYKRNFQDNFTNTQFAGTPMIRPIFIQEQDPPVGINELEKDFGLNLYPNPTYSKVYIQSEGEISNVSVFNLQGQEILNLDNTNNFDLSSFNNGVYLVRVTNNKNQTKIQRIVKQ